jgi:bla regulator protein BlaR1
MQHLFQSTFLQALGYAIANSLWQTALVWLVYMSVTGIVSMSAAAKYRLAVSLQVIGFAWFLITFQFYYHQYSNAWQLSKLPVSENVRAILSSNTDISSQLINWMVKGEQLLPYVSMAYLLLMIFLCTRWLIGYRQTQLIRYSGLQKIPANWRLFVKKIASQLGITKEIRIFLSENVTTPLTIGFLKPIILIPVASINHLSTDQLEAVLLHEMAHIKRYDYLVNILLSVVEISLFFNPFTQLLSKCINKERENSCDDWVLQFQYNASVYAEALLRIAYLQSSPAFAMAASGKKRNELLIRVKRMIDKKENHFSYRKQLLAFVIVTGILSSLAWLNPITPHAKLATVTIKGSQPLIKSAQPYAIEPMAVSVDNPLFNPVFFLSKPLKEEMKKNIASAQKEMGTTVSADVNEQMGFIESIPPLVAGALKQASAEMAAQKPAFEKQIAEMETARLNLDRVMKTDSIFMDPKTRIKLKEDINQSMKKMNAEIRQAKSEMERGLKIAEASVDKEKIMRDIQKALESVDQLNKMGLDKIIMGALQIPGMMLDEKNKHASPPAPEKDSERMKRSMPSPASVADELPRMMMPGLENEKVKEEITIQIEEPEFIRMPARNLRVLSQSDKIKLFTLLRAKMILWRDSSLRIIPVFRKDNRIAEDPKIIIQLQ